MPRTTALALLLAASSAAAQPGPAASAAAAAGSSAAVPLTPPWQEWPHGRPFGGGVDRPADGARRLCSFEAPVCVHASIADEKNALATLQEAERAHQFLRLQARLPRPVADLGAGGSDAFDIYLSTLSGNDGPLRLGFGLPTRMPVDQAPVHAVIDRRLAGCERAVAVHEAMAAAQLAAVDGAEAGASFASSMSYLAMLGSGCRADALARMDEAQAHPERPLLDPGDADTSRASPLVPWWLDEWLGSDAPGALVTGLWYGAQQSTPAADARFHNKPDLMTVVRRLARAREVPFDQMLLDLAVTRAFLGDRDDGAHLAESAWLEEAGRVRFDASWKLRELPRRLAFRPLEPTGMVYTWVDLRGAEKVPGSIGLHFTWEYPVTVRWAVVRVDADGREMSRLSVAHSRGDTKADAIVEQLDGVAGLLIVGSNTGEVDLEKPFFVDETPYESHGGTIHVYVP